MNNLPTKGTIWLELFQVGGLLLISFYCFHRHLGGVRTGGEQGLQKHMSTSTRAYVCYPWVNPFNQYQSTSYEYTKFCDTSHPNSSLALPGRSEPIAAPTSWTVLTKPNTELGINQDNNTIWPIRFPNKVCGGAAVSGQLSLETASLHALAMANRSSGLRTSLNRKNRAKPDLVILTTWPVTEESTFICNKLS